MVFTLFTLFCMGLLQLSAQQMDWYSLWGSSIDGSHIRAGKMAIDSQENIYVAASFSGNAVAIESQTIQSKQGADLGDAVLVKMTSDKKTTWMIPFSESGTAEITDLAIDDDDNIVVVGTFKGVLNPGGQQQMELDKGEYEDCSVNGFVARFDKEGKLLGQWRIPAYEMNSIRLSLDKAGNIYVGGTYGSHIEIGGETMGSVAVDNQLFIAKYNQEGEVVWKKVTEDRSLEAANAVLEVDRNGEIYFAVTFIGTFTFGNTDYTTTIPDRSDMLFCKYDATGEGVWAKQLGGDGNEEVVDIAISPLGDVALGSIFTSGFMTISDVDSTFIYTYREGSTLPHMAVTTFTGDGEFRWQYWHGYSTTAEAYLSSLYCSDEGIYYLAGYVSGRAADISTGTVIAGVNSGIRLADGQHISHNTNGGADAIYLVLSPKGELCNYARPGGQQTEILADIVLSPDKKSVYFLFDLCVRAAEADIPLDNLFVSFTDININSKRDDFTMITVPCPEAPVGGVYGNTYRGSFFSTCLVKYSFPEITPNADLPDYVTNTSYSQTFVMHSPEGEPLFISLNLPEEFSMTDNELIGTPIGDGNYSITLIASDKTPRYSYFAPYAGDNTWDQTYGGETTRGNNRNVRNFIIRPVLAWKGEETDPILYGNWNQDVFDGFAFNYDRITTIDFTGVEHLTDLPVMENLNPNGLIYVDVAQRLSGTNIIEFAGENYIGSASDVVLTDGYDFYNTREFNAATITYTRDFSEMNGWASFCLPFVADMSSYEIREFSAAETVTEQEETVTKVSFTTTHDFEVNKPYLFKVDETMEEITFNGIAENGKIYVPATSLLSEEKAGVIFKSNYREIGKGEATDLYILYTDGSRFGKGVANSYIPSFRAYIEDVEGRNAKAFTVDLGEGTTNADNLISETDWSFFSANGVLTIRTDSPMGVTIRTIDGCVVGIHNLNEGENAFTNLAKGMYLINNRKVIVK